MALQSCCRIATELSEGTSDEETRRNLREFMKMATPASAIALQNERNDVDILRRRMDASVLLIKALGGGWTVSELPKPPARIFINVPAWNGGFDIEVDCIAAVF
jgi:hypothetical protein